MTETVIPGVVFTETVNAPRIVIDCGVVLDRVGLDCDDQNCTALYAAVVELVRQLGGAVVVELSDAVLRQEVGL